MSYLDALKNLEMATPPSVESVETPDRSSLDTFDTTQPGHLRFFSPPSDPEEAAREAAEERAAILEHEVGLTGQTLTAWLPWPGLLRHLFGPAKDTAAVGHLPGRYCAEGLRLRELYYSAAAAAERPRRSGR